MMNSYSELSFDGGLYKALARDVDGVGLEHDTEGFTLPLDLHLQGRQVVGLGTSRGCDNGGKAEEICKDYVILIIHV